MKKYLILIMVAMLSFVKANAQFELTPRNFVVENDSSKSYTIISFEGMNKHDLYIAAKGYLESIFNNPQKVLTCTDDESIVVDYEGGGFSVAGGFSWASYAVSYKHKIDFKDGRVRVSPFFKYAKQHGGTNNGNIIDLIGSNFLSKDAVFSRKSGKVIFRKCKEVAEKECNAFVLGLKEGIKQSQKDSEW